MAPAARVASHTVDVGGQRTRVERIEEKRLIGPHFGRTQSVAQSVERDRADAVYLTSINLAVANGVGKGASGGGDSDSDGGSPVTLFGTVSPTRRGTNENIQNSGFFPEVWLGAAMDQGVISARIT